MCLLRSSSLLMSRITSSFNFVMLDNGINTKMARSKCFQKCTNTNQRFFGNVCLSSERWTNIREIEEKNQIPIKIKSIYQNIFSMQNWYWVYICTIEILFGFKTQQWSQKMHIQTLYQSFNCFWYQAKNWKNNLEMIGYVIDIL